MLTRPVRTAVALVVLVATTQGVPATQDSPENLVVERAVAASRKSEPEWRFIPGILNSLGLLMDEQLGAAGGMWERLPDESTSIFARVYAIATAESAARWMDRQAHGKAPKGWTVLTYEAGDGATMSTCPDPRGFTQYEATIRKGRFLVLTSGRSKKNVELFANILVAAVAN
jgi:hypothetical protein